ncbi:2', 3'cyclic nucleotide phosphodiesterase SpdA [Ensifer soli]|uniref:2', 3'cyclic nucleotide phosphodiesterase SpdA n=1 Tax=Ciceribacter sp. sgz301302 TaxID=3342379 RepID=UPI0035BA658B
MSKIIVFTDLHMVPEGETIIGLDPYKRLEAGIAHVNANHADADCVVVTGDLTHHGDRDSYRRLKTLIDRLAPPVALTIGNHDRRDTFLKVFADVVPDENGFVQQVVDLADARLILLDTLMAPPYDYPDSHAGILCAARLDWLGKQLQADGRPSFLFLHHPPHPTGFSGMDMIRLVNGEALHDLIGRFGHVRHIVAGHVHRTISGSYRGISFSVFKSTVHQQPMPFAQPDPSLSVDEPAAYGILVVTPEGVLVHTEDYEIAAGAVAANA